MEWKPDAKAAIDRAPFFVRRLARRKVEELVLGEGRCVVTLADVSRAKAVSGPAAASDTVVDTGPGPS